ncbi:MAG: hypothetical protein LBH82_04795 [Bacteroidales bacterium]|jgi:hypothetical protein|nr:hypothetical protein [Bacteroidales bacterium]
MDKPLQGEAVVRGKERNTTTGTPLGVQYCSKNVTKLVRQLEAARIFRTGQSLSRTDLSTSIDNTDKNDIIIHY